MSVQLRRERNAFEVLAFAIIFALAAPGAFHLQPLPPSLSQAPVLGHAAAAFLVAGAAVGLLSMAIVKRHDASILAEQSAMVLAGIACLAYIVALIQATSIADAAWAIAFTAVIFIGCTWRFVQIQNYVQQRRAVQSGRQRRPN